METTTAWHRVLNDPQLRELPYKVETNEHGQIVLRPHKLQHGLLQSRITDLLRDHLQADGARAVEFAVETRKGVKVPDVVWISEDRLARIPDDAEASPVVPDLVVEVLSESNTESEIAEKRRLYFDEGAGEVWTGGPDGTLSFYDADGARDGSALVPSFPSTVD